MKTHALTTASERDRLRQTAGEIGGPLAVIILQLCDEIDRRAKESERWRRMNFDRSPNMPTGVTFDAMRPRKNS